MEPILEWAPAVDQVRRAVEAQIRELEPAVAELERLRGVEALLDAFEASGDRPELSRLLAALGFELAQEQAGSATIAGTAIRRGRNPGRDGRVPQGANKQRIMGAVLAHPGITAREVSDLTEIKRTTVTATINRLKRNGELEAAGRGVRIPASNGKRNGRV